ncbi:MAG TPA: SDR family NAD(P)-dependent oxidoreductase [Caulobacteraceae bacterium]|jgi:NAD(P)-dependent dehydrogenase (short-subunit alcohol dehydrogenase family)|nr:SDR family NAD(P)-dependent oxidoreductase [Caulobacteraceae bacterium]
MTTPKRPLDGRIAVVTGATRGIGRAAALALGAAGAKIIAVGRTQGALTELDDEIQRAGGPSATLVPLDLTNGPGVDALGGAIFERHQRLDILVHAAAMLGGLRPISHTPPELWDRIISTNLSSAFRLIRSLEPLLRASDAGRAVFLTCEAASAPKAFWGAMAATKAGLEALVRCWADETDVSPFRAILLDPGPMRTRQRWEAFPGEDAASLPDPALIGPMLVAMLCEADPGPPNAIRRFAEWSV